MAEENYQERTEQATPRRREKAREEGQVAKSLELNSAIMILLGFSTLLVLGPYMVDSTLQLMKHLLGNAASIAVTPDTTRGLFADNLMRFFSIIGPTVLALLMIGLAATVTQVGFRVSTKAISPKFDKLNIVDGLKRLFSMKTAVMGVRDVLKLAVIVITAYTVISGEMQQVMTLSDMAPSQLAATIGRRAIVIAIKIGVAMLVIALLDLLYQRWQFEKSIKMSKQDVRDEMKETEGSPQIKARIRQIQCDLARRRMMQDVPTADVVITNPTHLAVAIKYDHDKMNAPFVVAKGERLIAQRIREIAAEHNIPVIEDKPLARALFKMCEVGQIIPAALYRAVAEVLAYVYRLRGKGVN